MSGRATLSRDSRSHKPRVAPPCPLVIGDDARRLQELGETTNLARRWRQLDLVEILAPDSPEGQEREFATRAEVLLDGLSQPCP